MAEYVTKASVLMSCFNSAIYLSEAIDSILDQSYRNFEFIIVNDGSADDSSQIIAGKTDSRIKVINNEANHGLIYSLNRGLDICKGEFVIRMDADDISEPGRFARLIEFMDNNPDVGACSSYFEFGIGSNNIIKYPLKHEEIYLGFLNSCPFGHAPAIIRRSVLTDDTIKYDPEFIHSEDSNLWVRLLNITHLANYPEMLYRVRLHRVSITKVYQEQVNRSFRKARDLHFSNICKKLGEEAAILPFQMISPDFNHIKLLETKVLTLISKNESSKLFDSSIFRNNLVLLWQEVVNDLNVLSVFNMMHVISSPLLRYSDNSVVQRLRFIRKWLRRGFSK